MQFRKGEFDMSTLDQDKIYTSKSLQEEMNAERMLEGKEPLPAINPLRGGTGTLARKRKVFWCRNNRTKTDRFL